jgi:3-hydroxyacyl-[acyl-carrier-protein] dehydratase
METAELIPEKLLPHRAPMLLIDKVLETDYANTITVQALVKRDAVFMQGHFPNYPLLPGVILIEMMFQAGGILNRISGKDFSNKALESRMGRAVKIKSATFYKEVLAESIVTIYITKKSTLFNFSEYSAVAKVGEVKVCVAEITISI